MEPIVLKDVPADRFGKVRGGKLNNVEYFDFKLNILAGLFSVSRIPNTVIEGYCWRVYELQQTRLQNNVSRDLWTIERTSVRRSEFYVEPSQILRLLPQSLSSYGTVSGHYFSKSVNV